MRAENHLNRPAISSKPSLLGSLPILCGIALLLAVATDVSAQTGSASNGTSLSASGQQGDYTLTSTVGGFAAAAPTGTVTFVNTTSGVTLGTATLSSPKPGFFSAYFGVGNGPSGLAVQDFNKDGNLDMAVVNTTDNTVSILLGNGSGVFQSASNSPIAVGNVPVAVVSGDFNGDGKLDLAVANNADSTVTILLGNGDGTFTQAMNSPIKVGTTPVSVAAADLTGNGKIDLVSANQGSNTVTVLLGNGDGTFSPATGSLVIAGESPSNVAVADVNGDQKPDLVITNGGDNTVSVLLGAGNGTFSSAPESPIVVGNDPQWVTIADVNGDGIPDLAIANTGDDTMSVLFGAGNGIFSPASYSPVAVANSPAAIQIANFNGANTPGMAVANRDSGDISILLPGQAAVATIANIGIAGTGPQLVQANYAGDSNYAPSASSLMFLLASGQSTTTALTSSLTPSVYGQSVTFTATVTPSSGSTVPTGTVTFYDGTTSLGVGTLNSSGMTMFAESSLGVGSHSITATYSGDSNFAGSTSMPQTETITQATPVITWTVPASITYGTPLSATQLSATTPVQGGFSYNPGPGTVLGVGSQTLSVTFTPTDSIDYSTATQTAHLIVNTAALSVTANNATRLYGASNPTFTTTVIGSANGDTFTETPSTTAMTTSAVGMYPITVGSVTGANIADYSVTTNNGTLTVTQAGSSVQLSTSVSGPVADGASVVLTARVSSATTGTPTGSVTFMNGLATLALGPVTLSQGVATLTISTLPSGSDNLTASYGGDSSFTGSTSLVETVSVNSPDYAVSATPSSATLAAGQSTNPPISITVTPLGYSGTVTFTCGNLPAYISCAFSPSSGAVTFASGATAAQTLTLTVSVASTVSALEGRHVFFAAALLPLGLLAVLPMIGEKRKRLRLHLLIASISLAAGLGIAGCNSASNGAGSSTTSLPPAGAQTVMVTASGASSSGTISHQLQISVDITN